MTGFFDISSEVLVVSFFKGQLQMLDMQFNRIKLEMVFKLIFLKRDHSTHGISE